MIFQILFLIFHALLVKTKEIKEETIFPWDEKLSISAIKLWEIRKKCFKEYKRSLNKVISKYCEMLKKRGKKGKGVKGKKN